MSSIAEFRLGYNIIVITASGYFSFKCIATLKKSRAIDRKGLLTFVFAANLLSWILIVMPHLIFFDFFAYHFHFAVFIQDLFIFHEVLVYSEKVKHLFSADDHYLSPDVEGVKKSNKKVTQKT